MCLTKMRYSNLVTGALAVVILLSAQMSLAGPIRDRLMERRVAQQQDDLSEEDTSSGQVSLPAGVRLVRDVSYGKDAMQRMDVYLPRQAVGAPVIFMVHGGGWRRGDKGMKAVVENKMTRWVSKGFIFISTNYRLLPDTAPAAQAQDVASALAAAQGKAAAWGGDPAKFILMGHSAGAHLVAFLAASPAMALRLGARPWLGTISLDSAALDVVQIMEARHFRLYDQAFGKDPAYWRNVSPFHELSAQATPFLAVCSARRSDACQQARRFVGKAVSFNVRASVLEQDLSHKDINQQLGGEGGYTDAVETFMGALDESVMRALTNHSGGAR
jgi:arylformamidase